MKLHTASRDILNTPIELEEALINELASPEIRKRGRDAVIKAIDSIDKLRAREKNPDILIAYQQIFDAIDGDPTLIAKTIRAIDNKSS